MRATEGRNHRIDHWYPQLSMNKLMCMHLKKLTRRIHQPNTGFSIVMHATATFGNSVGMCYLKGTSTVSLTPYASARGAMSTQKHKVGDFKRDLTGLPHCYPLSNKRYACP